VQKGNEKGGATTLDRRHGLFDPLQAEAVLEGKREGGRVTVDRQLGLFSIAQLGHFDPSNSEAVLEGNREGARKQPWAAKAKGGAAGKGVKKPRLTAAQKAHLPQGPCSGCGKSGVVGAQHNKPKAVTGGKAEMCGRYQASE
jgi:hypothetical protein